MQNNDDYGNEQRIKEEPIERRGNLCRNMHVSREIEALRKYVIKEDFTFGFKGRTDRPEEWNKRNEGVGE